LGLNPFASFDWNWFATKFDPTVIPSVFLLQMVLSMFVWAICVIIPVFFTNTFYSAYMPLVSIKAFAPNNLLTFKKYQFMVRI